MEASAEASQMMIAALGPSYQPLTTAFGMPVTAVFSAGANTVQPHGLLAAGAAAAVTCSSPARPPTWADTIPSLSGQ